MTHIKDFVPLANNLWKKTTVGFSIIRKRNIGGNVTPVTLKMKVAEKDIPSHPTGRITIKTNTRNLVRVVHIISIRRSIKTVIMTAIAM